jgi:hypothetical protein
MTNNTATFSTGKTISRNSVKHYSFAWLATNVQRTVTQSASGFATTEQGAIRAAKAVFSGFSGTTRMEVVNTSN